MSKYSISNTDLEQLDPLLNKLEYMKVTSSSLETDNNILVTNIGDRYFETVNKDSDAEETNLPDLETPKNNKILNKSIIDSEITLAFS